MQIAKSWRRQATNLRLEGTRCVSCGRLEFSAVMRCSACQGMDFEEYRFKGTGTVLVASEVYEAPRDFAEHVPYPAALIKLDEGVTVPAMLTDIDMQDVVPGLKVEMVTRRIAAQGEQGPIVYAYKFAPILED